MCSFGIWLLRKGPHLSTAFRAGKEQQEGPAWMLDLTLPPSSRLGGAEEAPTGQEAARWVLSKCWQATRARIMSIIRHPNTNKEISQFLIWSLPHSGCTHKHSMGFPHSSECSFNLSWTTINPRDCPYPNEPREEIMLPSLTGQKASPSSQIPLGKVKMLTHLDASTSPHCFL